MPLVVLITHADLAQSALKTLEYVSLRNCDNFLAFSSTIDKKGIDINASIVSKIKKFYKNDGIIFVTDIFMGGSYLMAVEIAKNFNNCEIISGFNLSTLIRIDELLRNNDYTNVLDIAKKAVQSAKRDIVIESEALEQKIVA